ncbi:cardiolipin synthase [Herbaspirillum rubrisubalbicans]|uniref:cardiolipin synthase n=1 Tax=Herbaspirillum rubrisubalbicans TaxID=80842 RepID=UPI001558600A|nr:cardiolipin synthase [Herbaspirillum rubrisubalbicans]NQE50159.1 cardiolipin synthase [Herbaspirillum rubrisubalbicans]
MRDNKINDPHKSPAGRCGPAWLLLVLLSLTLAACSSLPTIVPDMDTQSARTIQMKGGRGVLSAAQSKAVLDKLRAQNADNTILDRHVAIEGAITGSPLVTGNKVTLLIDGPATYASMQQAIQAARYHINMETYIMEDDEVGRQFADLLIAMQNKGVQVNLMYDSVGALNTPRAFFQPMIDAGIHVLEYNPLNPTQLRKDWEVNQRDHRKLLVVDGKTAFVGGINISSVYSSGSFSSRKKKPQVNQQGQQIPWRDTQVRIDGPVALEFQKLFINTWQQQRGPDLGEHRYFPQVAAAGNEIVRAIGSSPDDPYSVIYATFISAIQHAESTIYLTNAYFVPDPQLRDALKAAARRGVDVRLILPSHSDSSLVLYASRSFYAELLEAGIRIYERQDALLHSKTALIDGVWSTIGSTNLDWRSFVYNQEINAVILSPAFGVQMKSMFERDLGASREITREQWGQRPISERMKEFGASLWARLL